jgi:FkbM family methyltransferase
MTDYSQYEEQLHIKEFFGDKVGTFLDVGAADGITFSNVYQLLLDGWSGVSIEPEVTTFRQLINNYEQFGDKSELVMTVIDQQEGFVTFYENGQLSSTSHEHMANWEWHRQENGYEWRPVTHYAITLNMLLKNYASRNFDFISIDIEGQNHDVICSTDWNLVPGCKLLCIEHDQNEHRIIAHLERYGFSVYHMNVINLLMSRNI